MGYTTDFYGSFQLNKPLDPLHKEYLTMFSDTRRMRRDFNKLSVMKASGKGNRRCFALLDELHLGLGVSGDFYCGTGMCGQDGGHFNTGNDDSVVDYNSPANGQPGLWCHWVPNDTGTEIVWDNGEKFYEYVEWIKFIVSTFLKPWGYKLNGIVEWQGEDREDTGVIQIVDNAVITHSGKRRSDFNPIPKVEATPKPIVPSVAPTTTSEVILDLIKLRNDLANSKKGTAVACKKLDELIKKYGV
jgi:hypothetical protein